jgi:DNA-binding CsgD family transcriptional regulator
MGAAPLVLLQPTCPPDDDPGLLRLLQALAAGLHVPALRLELRPEGESTTRTFRLGPPLEDATAVPLPVRGLDVAAVYVPSGTRLPPGSTALAAFAVEQALSAFDLRRQALLLRGALDTTTSAVLLFQPTGDIIYANPPADRLLSRQTEDLLVVERPGAKPTPLFDMLCSLVERIAASSTTGSWLGTLAVSDGSVLACELLQVRAGHELGQSGVLAIVQTVTALPDRYVDALVASYGFSPREEEVARLLREGLTTSSIADRLSLSPHTVRDHLRKMYHKTGTRSRRDLLGLLQRATLAPPLAPERRQG